MSDTQNQMQTEPTTNGERFLWALDQVIAANDGPIITPEVKALARMVREQGDVRHFSTLIVAMQLGVPSFFSLLNELVATARLMSMSMEQTGDAPSR